MPFSYNLNTYSHHQMQQWLSVLYRNQILEETIRDYFEKEAISPHYPLNEGIGFLKLASGMFFNRHDDYQYLLPGDLMQALSAGIEADEILAIIHGKHYHESSINIFSPLHFFNESKHLLATSGTHSYHAATGAGLARSLKVYESQGIVVCPLTQQAFSEGIVYESILAADEEKLPVLYLIHGYEQTRHSDRADLFGRLKNTYLSYCDNTSLFDAVNATRKAYRMVKEEQIPVILAGKGSLNSEQMFENYTDALIESEKFTKEEIRDLGDKIRKELKKAHRIIHSLNEPNPAQLIRQTIKGYEAKELSPHKENSPVTLSQAINGAISGGLEKYRHSFYLSGSEDGKQEKEAISQIAYIGPKSISLAASPGFVVASAGGMCYYKDDIRIITMPSQNAASLWEIMNQLSEIVFLTWKTQQNIHLLIRLPLNGYDGSGPFLSQKPEAALLAVPGIRIIYPAFADDAAGLIRTALKSPGITVMLESKALYEDVLAAAAVHPHHEVGFGSARILRKGTDITLITWGNTVHLAMRAAEKIAANNNYQVEVVDLRSILPVDKSTILRSIHKTHKALVVSEGYLFANAGAEIAAMVNREAFTMLQAPVGRVGSVFTPMPYQKEAERMVLPSVSGIMDETLDILEY